MKKFIHLFFIAITCSACTKDKVKTVEEYAKWINTPEHGLISTKRIKGLEVTVKYLPNQYLIYKELKESEEKDNTGENEKRITKEYENAITFLMTIGPDETKNKNDILFDEIKNYKAYSERLLAMNFELDKNITLKTTGVTLKPVLSALENTYGLSKSRNILLVFSPDDNAKVALKNAKMLDLVYTDELFSLGIMHFEFERKNMETLPSIDKE